MNILFYTPLNTRCRDIESQAIEFSKKKHTIFLLTQSAAHILHENFRSYGFTVAAKPVRWQWSKWILIKRWVDLVLYCWRNRVDVVYAHLEPANFIAVLAQYVISARVIICRHHVDEASLYSFSKDLSYRLTYTLARNIIVVSERAKQYMITRENIPAERIHRINLSYNFQLYTQPDFGTVEMIRKQYAADVILLSICRLTKYKRPELSIQVVQQLLAKGIHAKLIILGKGELMDSLKEYVDQHKLRENVYLPGYVNNVQDYMAAADFMIHPSLLESSCISVKEAGILKRPVIVCENIGDFNEVINNGRNGFIVNADRFVEESTSIISAWYNKKEELREIGSNLRTTVLKLFDIQNTAPCYEETFHKQKSKNR